MKKTRVPYGLQKMMLEALKEERKEKRDMLKLDVPSVEEVPLLPTQDFEVALYNILQHLPYYYKKKALSNGRIWIECDVRDIEAAAELLKEREQ